MPFIVLALIIAAALGATVSVAAQDSLPGDPLWGFKVHINEGAAAALAAEGRAQADLDLAAIATRLQEAATLSAKGILSPAAKAELEANIAGHAERIETEIKKLQTHGDYLGAADVATRFQATVAQGVSGPLDLQAVLDRASALSASATPLP
ncbi:hypothetical protein EXS62_01340 [Candidatus Kaiserbacteria bacterium]|nr:hypothetical protein [Candidatus Kaiserbacteria bacterium]